MDPKKLLDYADIRIHPVKKRPDSKVREFWVAPFAGNPKTCNLGGESGRGQYCEVNDPGNWAGAIKVRQVLD